MKMESEAILSLIFDHYDDAVLLLCKSEGSSLADCFDQIVARKVAESAAFFQALDAKRFDTELLSLLIGAQLYGYRKIVQNGYERDVAKRAMQALMRYHMGGWTALLNAAQEDERT